MNALLIKYDRCLWFVILPSMQSITMLENEKFMILWYKCGISVPFLTISNHKKITTKTKIKILFDMRVYFSHKVGKVV